MLDKSIPFYDLIMQREKGTTIPKYVLPTGYRFSFFNNGDEKQWAEIEASVGEFKSVEEALTYFQNNYLTMISEIKRRCIFIENEHGLKVATLTNWWGYTGVRRDPWLHWVAVRPEFQGIGLGKALVFKGLNQMEEIEGDRHVYLHTQTWSYKAIKIYMKAGFNITSETGLGGYLNNNYSEACNILSKYIA